MSSAKRRMSLVVAMLTLAVGAAGRAEAGIALGVDFTPGILYDIDAATAAVSNARSTNITNLVGIAYDGSSTLYGLTALASTGTANALYRINPGTGAATLVGATGLNNIFEGGLAYDASTDTLYGIQDVPAAYRLFTLNRTTGAATIVGNISSSSDLSALEFDAAGNLYMIDSGSSGNSVLLRIDKANGTILGSVTMNHDLGATVGMGFDPITGRFYVGDDDTGTLYTLNVTTGSLSSIGAFSPKIERLSGLTFAPGVVPEPTALVSGLIGAALVGGVWWPRHRRT